MPLPARTAGYLSAPTRPPDHMSTTALGLALVLTVYLLATVICYNDFLGVAASSRWPLIVLTLLAGPIACAYALSTRHRLPAAGFSLGWLLAIFLVLELFHALLGLRTEVIGVVSLLGLAVFAILTQRRTKADLVGALALVCALYLPLVYPLAYGSGMVGAASFHKGVFVAQYLPGIDSLSMNGHFKSGRGVIGIVGGVIVLYCLVRLGARRSGPLHLAGVGLGGLALLTSDSRGVILACLLAAVALLAPLPAALRARTLFAMPLGIAAAQPFLLLLAIRHRDLVSDLSVLSRQDIVNSDLTRVFAWGESVRLITSSAMTFLFGYGNIGSAKAMENAFARNYPDIEQLVSSHNLLLQLLMDGGVVLLVLFLGYLLRIAAFGWRNARQFRRRDLDAIAILSFLLMYAATGSLVSLDRINEGMFVFVLTLLAIDRQMREVEPPRAAAASRWPSFRAGAGCPAPRPAP